MTQQRCPPGFESGKSSFLGIVELTCDSESMTQQRCPTGDFCWETLHPIDTSISSANIINAKQGFEGSLISRNVELSPQKPLKWSSDLQGWSVAEQYIDRARSESRLTTMTSFETKLKKDWTSFIWRDRAASIRRWLRWVTKGGLGCIFPRKERKSMTKHVSLE